MCNFLLSFLQFKSGQRELTHTSVDKSRYFLFGNCGLEKSLNLQEHMTTFKTVWHLPCDDHMGLKWWTKWKEQMMQQWCKTLTQDISPPKTLKETWTSIERLSSLVFECSTYSECRMELRHVQRSSGSMADNVIMLLNFASRMLRCLPAACVWLAKVSPKEDSFRRLVKYYTQNTVKFMSFHHVTVQLVYLKLFAFHIRGMLRRQSCLIMEKKESDHDSSHEEIPGQQCS